MTRTSCLVFTFALDKHGSSQVVGEENLKDIVKNSETDNTFNNYKDIYEIFSGIIITSHHFMVEFDLSTRRAEF